MNGLRSVLETLRGEAGKNFVVLLLLNSAEGLVTTLASPYLQSIGFPLASVGFLVSVSAVAALLSRLPAGRLAEGNRARLWFWIACSTYAAALFAYPFATEAWAFWLVRAVHGLSNGAATTLNFASFLSAAAGSGAHRSRATVIYTTVTAVGYGFGNFGGGVLADNFGYPVAFTVAALNPLVALVFAPRSGAGRGPAPVEGAAIPAGFWDAIRKPEVQAVPTLAFCINFMHQMFATLLPLHLLAINETLTLAGTARGVQSVASATGRALLGPLLNRFGSFWVGFAGLIIIGSTGVLVPMMTAPVLIVGLFVIIGTGRAMAILSNSLTTVELSTQGVVRRGTAAALMSAGTDIGSILAPSISGAIGAVIGIGGSMQVTTMVVTVFDLAVLASSRLRANKARRALEVEAQA